MSELHFLTRPEITLLVGDMIREHESEVAEPKHSQNTKLLTALTLSMNTFEKSLIKIETTINIFMKFAGAGIIVWSLRQVVDMIQALKH